MEKTQKQLNEFQKRFKAMSDEELIGTFNGDVGNPGWVSARAVFQYALHEEFESRSFDFSAIGNKNRLSFADKIKLIGKKIIKQNMINLNQKIPNTTPLEAEFQNLRGILNPSDEEMKQIFTLSEEEFQQLDKTYPVSQQGQKPQPQQPQEQFQNQPQVQPVERQTKQESEIFFIPTLPKPSEGMQVTFFQKSPEEYKRRLLDRKRSKK